MTTLLEALTIAIEHHQAGRLGPAEEIYRQVLAAEPQHADALHLLGVIALQTGNAAAAIQLIAEAIELNPAEPAYFCNLGNAYRTMGRWDDAIGAYGRALEIRPEFPEALNNLGAVYQSLQRVDEAIACYRKCLAVNADFADALGNLGGALLSQGRLDDAIECLRGAIELKENDPSTHNNLGSALLAQGQLDAAIGCFRRALELLPDLVEAHVNLGNALQGQGRPDEAVESHQRALQITPDSALAQNNLGTVLKDQGRVDEAIGCFRRALAQEPSYNVAWSNLLYTLYFSPAYDAAAIYEEHCRWYAKQAAPLAEFIAPHGNVAKADRPLRVGYISPNFRKHAESFFLAPLFSAHNHERFEIFCYSDVMTPDEITDKLRSYSDVWRSTYGLSDEQAAQLVRSDQIDILVDLTMQLANGRPLLFARKPAPVQLCWLAYQGTTGLATMDYRLTDPHLDPPGLFDRYYSEESIRLPDSFWCYDPLTNEPAVNALPALKNGFVTFGSLNNFCKVNDNVLRLWAGVLRKVDRSKLVLLAGEGSHRQRTLEFLEAEGIAQGRIVFERSRPRPDYLKLYEQIDLGLDTFPYNGQTTTLDAVWMGVPMVTIIGQTSAARAGASLLYNLGTPELVANSPEEFVSIAAELANDHRRLADFRATLRALLQRSPLMDAPRFAHNVEAAYRSMWQRWCAGVGAQAR